VSALELITLVIYDIPDDGLRYQVAKYLKSKGLKRIQKSVIAGLKRLIRGKGASIEVCPLTPASFNQRVVLGVELKYEEEHLV